MNRRSALGFAGAAAAVGAALVAQRSAVNRRRRNDPEASEQIGKRRAARSRRIDLPDGVRLFVEESGPPVPSGVVFLHGLALRTDLWYYQLEGLGSNRSIFYDARGHGLSLPKGDADFSIGLLADDLEAVLDECGLNEVVLVGHSTGGMTVLEYCRSRPDQLRSRVKGIVLANTTYRPAPETVRGGAAIARLERMVRRPLDLLGTQSVRVDKLRKIIRPSDALFLTVAYAGFGPSPSAKHVDATYDMLSETPSDVVFDVLRAYRDFDVTEALSTIDVPALVISGTHDRLTVKAASEHIAASLPDARLEVLENVGHMPMYERHRTFNALVQGFVDEVLTGSVSRDGALGAPGLRS